MKYVYWTLGAISVLGALSMAMKGTWWGWLLVLIDIIGAGLYFRWARAAATSFRSHVWVLERRVMDGWVYYDSGRTFTSRGARRSLERAAARLEDENRKERTNA